MFTAPPMRFIRAVNLVLLAGISTLPFGVAFPADSPRNGPPPVTGLVGHVSDAAGVPVPDVHLRVAMPASVIPVLSFPIELRWDAMSNAKGDYCLELPAIKKPTNVSIVAFRSGYLRFMSTLSSTGPPAPIVIVPGAVTHYAIVLEPALRVAGVVTDQKGSPIGGVRIEGNTFAPTPLGDIDRTETDKDGAFGLFNYPLNPVQGDGETYKGAVLFCHPDYVDQQIDDLYALTPKQRQSLRIVLKAGHRMAGRVLDVAGKPVADALVVCQRPDGTNRRGTKTDSKGVFALGGIADGAVVLNAKALPIKEKTRLQMAVTHDANDLVIRLQAMKLPSSLKKYSLLGMQLVDVTPELQAAYDLRADYGVLVLDPGVEADRLGLNGIAEDGIAEGCDFFSVDYRGVVDVAQFLRQILATATSQGPDAIPVAYTCETPDFEAGMSRHLRLTNRDLDQLQTALDQFASQDAEVVAALRRAGAQFQFANVPSANQRRGRRDDRVVSAIILGKKWKGSDVFLRRAATLSTLQEVYVLADGRVTDQALEDLRKTRPRIDVMRIPKLSLGISVEAPEKGSVGLNISGVYPCSPAERAGLRSGDIIVEFAGKPIANMSELKKLMLPLKQGQSVVAKGVRNAKTFSVTIEIGKWD
jgi:PDZ domain